MDAGTILLSIVIAIVVAGLSSAMGWWLGPTLFAAGFLGFAALLLLGGEGQGFVVATGVVLLSAGIIELAAASVFWDARASRHGPSGAWRATAVLVGLGGSVGFFAVLAILAMAAVGLYSQL